MQNKLSILKKNIDLINFYNLQHIDDTVINDIDTLNDKLQIILSNTNMNNYNSPTEQKHDSEYNEEDIELYKIFISFMCFYTFYKNILYENMSSEK